MADMALGRETVRAGARFRLGGEVARSGPVTGADGHQATPSWGEIDPGYGDAGVLLATEIDDRPLDAEGPRLAVPRDKGGSRYVSQVTEIWIGPPR
jgi:hypothetical protein